MTIDYNSFDIEEVWGFTLDEIVDAYSEINMTPCRRSWERDGSCCGLTAIALYHDRGYVADSEDAMIALSLTDAQVDGFVSGWDGMEADPEASLHLIPTDEEEQAWRQEYDEEYHRGYAFGAVAWREIQEIYGGADADEPV